MNTLERRIKRIEELTPKPPRKVQVIMFCPDEETKEEAFAKAGVNREDPDLFLIIIQGVKPGDPGTRSRPE
jgi:hypothetical protein